MGAVFAFISFSLPPLSNFIWLTLPNSIFDSNPSIKRRDFIFNLSCEIWVPYYSLSQKVPHMIEFLEREENLESWNISRFWKLKLVLSRTLYWCTSTRRGFSIGYWSKKIQQLEYQCLRFLDIISSTGPHRNTSWNLQQRKPEGSFGK